MTFDRSERISVEGRVRFATPQAAQDFATALQGQNGTVFDCADGIPQYPNTWGTGQVAPIRVAGCSVYLTWSGLGGSNDHEHTYMVLSQLIEHAEHGCYVVSDDQGYDVFCLPGEVEDDHLAERVGAVWGNVSQIEFLRSDTTSADLPALLALWPELDTWGSKQALLMLLCDFAVDGQVPLVLRELFFELWATPEPTELCPEATDLDQELYDYWWAQAWTLMRVLDEDAPQVIDDLTASLEGEARHQKFAQYRAQALQKMGH